MRGKFAEALKPYVELAEGLESETLSPKDFKVAYLQLFHYSEVMWPEPIFDSLSVVRSAADDYEPEWDGEEEFWVDEAGLRRIVGEQLPILRAFVAKGV